MVIDDFASYIGHRVRIWIEDVSGEEVSKPVEHRLHRVERTDDGWVKFFINARQFVSVPAFENERTSFESCDGVPCFVSDDEQGQLRYRVYFLASR